MKCRKHGGELYYCDFCVDEFKDSLHAQLKAADEVIGAVEVYCVMCPAIAKKVHAYRAKYGGDE